MQTSVTVIIPVYNQEKTVGKCVESLLKQTHKCKIIVVNDGSADGSAKVVKSYPVKLIEIERSGKPTAINVALKDVATEFVLVGEGDAWYDENYIKNSLKYFDDPQVAGTIGSGYCTDPDRDFLRRCRGVEMDLKRENYRPFTAWLFKTKVLKEVGGYEERVYLHEDIVTCQKILKKGYRFAYARDAIWYHDEKTSLKDMAKQRFRWGIGYADNIFKVKMVPKIQVLASFYVIILILLPFWASVSFLAIYILYFLKILFTGKRMRDVPYYLVMPSVKIYRTLFSTLGFWFGIILKSLARDIFTYI